MTSARHVRFKNERSSHGKTNYHAEQDTTSSTTPSPWLSREIICEVTVQASRIDREL